MGGSRATEAQQPTLKDRVVTNWRNILALGIVALGVGYGLSNANQSVFAQAQENNHPSQSSEGTAQELGNFPQRYGDFEIFYPAIDPETGVPLANQQWIEDISRVEIQRSQNQNHQEAPEAETDPFNLEQVELSPENRIIIQKIYELTGIVISVPKNPSQIPGSAGGWGIKENKSPTLAQFQNIYKTFENTPEFFLPDNSVNKKSQLVDILFLIFGPSLGNGGVNSSYTFQNKFGFIASITAQSDINPNKSVKYRTAELPLLDEHGQIVCYQIGHEVIAHGSERQNDTNHVLTRFIADIGWKDNNTPPDGDPGDLANRGRANETRADAIGYLVARPAAFDLLNSRFPLITRHLVLESLRSFGSLRNWRVLYDGGTNESIVNEIIKNIDPKSLIPTPSITPTSKFTPAPSRTPQSTFTPTSTNSFESKIFLPNLRR